MLSEQAICWFCYPNKSLRSMLGLTIDKLSELFSYIFLSINGIWEFSG